MTLRCSIGAVLICAAGAGCRTPVGQELLERELHWQEMRIDELETSIEEYQRRLASCQRENEALLRERSNEGSAVRPGAAAGPAAQVAPPDVMLPGADRAEPYPGPPIISPPGEGLPEGKQVPPGALQPTDEAHQTGIPAEDRHQPLSRKAASGPSGPAATGPITAITLNPRLTGGYDRDGRAGDEGVLVVVEPRDAAGALIQVPGDVSIVVLDPAEQGSAARVARWDFSAEESAGHLIETPMGDGLHFELPWPHSAPKNETLSLYVRFVTAQGEKLVAEKQIRVDRDSRS